MPSSRLLYACNAFAVFDDGVEQGPFIARADHHALRSNYFTETPELHFKFSLGGRDNEFGYGVDHRLTLDPDTRSHTLPLLKFGRRFEQTPEYLPEFSSIPPFTRLTFRLDLREVRDAIRQAGGFRSSTGDWITEADLERVEICGNKPPLNWNFGQTGPLAPVRMRPGTEAGIFEATVVFHAVELDGDQRLLRLPEQEEHFFFHCESPLPEAIHRLAWKELRLNERPDGLWNTGAHWDGVWTRDAAYAIWLSLALADPQRAMACLRARVQAGRVLQDTGTGGGWPVSTDRVVWAVAAWEIYLATGDQEWLREAYALICRMLEEADATALNEEGVYRGETSFLDWRQQSYPAWMTPADIAASTALSTNILYALGWEIRAKMETLLDLPATESGRRAEMLKEGIRERFWHGNGPGLGQFRYGRYWLSLSQRPDSLALALGALGQALPTADALQVFRRTPVTPYGIPCFSPFIAEEPAYHNRGIWPFVQAFWAWALSRYGSEAMLVEALAAIWRPAALFLTHKENFRADNGLDRPTEVNSDRQLWSVAGALAIPLRMLAGIRLAPEGIYTEPAIPLFWEGGFSFSLKIRSTRWLFRFFGNGRKIDRMALNGAPHVGPLPYDAGPEAVVQVFMANEPFGDQMAPELPKEDALPTPNLWQDGGWLRWNGIPEARTFRIYRNGQPWIEAKGEAVDISACPAGSAFQAMALGRANLGSFLSEPIWKDGLQPALRWSPPDGPLFLRPEQKTFSATLDVSEPGAYWLALTYANGNGDVPNGDGCGLRTLYLNGKRAAVLIFPQRRAGNWDDTGFSTFCRAILQPGQNRLELVLEDLALPTHPGNNLVRLFEIAGWKEADFG